MTAGKPFVLVHGAWHGGWCWKRVVPLLQAAARPVYVATLTGLGERAHLAKSVTGLATHIDDVANLIECEELNDVVLVGHSYAGFVITGVADRMASRIRHLVFVDAVVPDDGDTWEGNHPPELAKKNKDAAAAGDGIGMPPLAAKYFGITAADDLAWVDRRLTPHPVATYVDKLALKHPPRNGLRSTFIDCYQPSLASIDRSKVKVQAEQGWIYQKLATAHDCMVTAPSALADLLLTAA
jgi:pimeloyl-ACP methyl ester carboxylesterase